MKIRTKKCKNCGTEIRVAGCSVRNYCSETCRRIIQYPESTLGLATGVVGARSELLASADLLKRGYEVYRSLSPHCSSDLIAAKDGKLLRIEVRTGRRVLSGNIVYSKAKFRSDHYAIVIEEEVKYKPELPQEAQA